MAELYIPRTNPNKPLLEPVHNMSCEVMHVATNIIKEQICIALDGPTDDLSTQEGQLTYVHNDLATGCGRACLKECGLWVDTNAKRIGIDVPVRKPEAMRRALAISAVSLGLDAPDFVLDERATYTKGVIEAHFKAAKPDATEVTDPAISDKAYQMLANLCEGNLRIALEIISKLHIAASDATQGSEKQHMVTPADLQLITDNDILRLFLHPKMQYHLRISKLPKSKILDTKTR